jgi:hypothetical protein
MWHMSNSNKILAVGIALVVIPLLGLPFSWKNFIFTLLGLWLCWIALIMRKERSDGAAKVGKKEGSVVADSFLENKPVKTEIDVSGNGSDANNHEKS